MTRIIDTKKARHKTHVGISNNNTYNETDQNKTTIDEAINWLLTLPLGCKNGVKAKQITDMAIHALMQPTNDDWERYSDFLWKEAYERGKQDALKDRPQGEWIAEEEDGDLWVCNQCGCVSGYKDNFCHNCGADMRGGTDD